jgi:hypothetical protein
VKHLTPFALVVSCAGGFAWSEPATAHPGGVDANGCHYERSTGKNWQDTYHCHEQKPANRDTAAPAKKSRENICHDAGSPNYSKLQYFVAYQTMKQCTTSGGRPYRH